MNYLFVAALVLFAASAQADWLQFRGPGANGVSDLKNLPLKWSATENIAWRTELPGAGYSSPIVVGRKIFVTTGIKGEQIPGVAPRKHKIGGTADFVHPQTSDADRKYELRVICLDADTGKVIWERTSYNGPVYDGKHSFNTYASPTPITDGKNVYVWFESQGMYAYDFDGKQKWKASFGGINALNLGPGSSPLMFEDLIIVQSDQDDGADSFIAAVRAKDGSVAWKTPRKTGASWSTPVLFDSSGKKEVITMATEAVIAYDPRTGKELWRGPGVEAFAANTPISGKGLIIAAGYHPKKKVLALRPDVPEDQRVAWSYDKGTAYIPSSIIYGDYLYLVADNGSLSCLDVATGAIKYEGKRMPKPTKYTASPVAFDGKILLSSNDGDTFVVKAGPDFEVLDTNSLDEPIHASLALDGDSIFLRTDKALYRIRAKK
ncbi:MAG: PQQ-binding-like beta-propeller repeat protein [Bryobacteraceae bacterium]